MGSKSQTKENKDKPSDLPVIDEMSKSDLKDKKKDRWKDNREDDKFVIEGAKIQCEFCSNPTTSLVVTSSQSQLQDKKWATIGDNNGATNLPFDGFCTAYPSATKPPCTEVIRLIGWQSFSFTTIDNYGALRKNSINTCAISGKAITIEHSGQTDEPASVAIEIPPIEVEIISIDTEYFTPLGIQNPQKPDFKSDGKIKIQYKISKQDARSISFSVFSKDGDLIGYDSLVMLDEVVITAPAPKGGGGGNTKGTEQTLESMFKEEHLKIGTHTIEWDGFDPNDILDTSMFQDQIILQIRVSPKVGGSARHRKSYKTSSIEPKAKWVTARVDKRIDPVSGNPKNEIDVLFNINLKDGGAKGINNESKTVFTNQQSAIPGINIPIQIETGDWDKVPRDVRKKEGAEPIKTRTKSYQDLANLVKEGVNTYWSRKNESEDIGCGINVGRDNYKVTVNTKNTELNSPYALDDIPLIFNTNGDWERSGNPGCGGGIVSGTTKIIDAIGDAIGSPLQQITYNVGYLEFSDGWGYWDINTADNEFKETSAHELGHEILQAFGGDIYSYRHKGSTSLSQSKRSYRTEQFPKAGEQDLMKYYYGSAGYSRIVAAEEDVKGLLWLTGIKIE